MQVRNINKRDERVVLVGLMKDVTLLGHVTPLWGKGGLFKTRYANIVGGWCVSHFLKYGTAPKKTGVEQSHLGWVERVNDDKTVELVEQFLNSLGREYKRKRETSMLVDLAEKHFNLVKLEVLGDKVKEKLERGDINTADELVAGYDKIKLDMKLGINPLQDMDAIRAAFNKPNEKLIKYDGALGDFFGNAFERDGFIAFMAPEKRGKSWWLIDIAMRAIEQGRNVAFFEAGDMSQNQIMRRLLIRIAKCPKSREQVAWPVGLNVHKKKIQLRVKRKIFNKGLSKKLAIKRVQKFAANLNDKGGLFKLACYPNSSLSVSTIKTCIDKWGKEGWVPDVVIIDYADILDMSVGNAKLDLRDRINDTWKKLRGLSQQHNCLVVTATQTDAASYNSKLLTRTHFSEDKRKFAHVTGMVGINGSDMPSVFRLNWIALREAAYDESTCVHVAGCLEMGNPAVISCY